MDYKIFNLKIDLGRESRNAVKPVQGESAVKLRATLTHNSQPYNLTDATVRCLFRKPDHTYSYIDAVVIDAAKGIVEIELTNQVLLLSGSVVAAIEVAGTIGIAKTWLFTMDVQPGIPYTDIESVDEFPAVEQMIIDIAEIKANFNAIVAGVTVDREVILARAGFTTLGERIDDLATKVNTTLPAQLAEIEQDKAEKTAKLDSLIQKDYLNKGTAMREAIKSLTNYTLTDEDLNQFRVSYDNYSWFVSFAPYENPEIAVVIIIPQGGQGYYSAPVARDIYAKYFNLTPPENPTDVIDAPQVEE